MEVLDNILMTKQQQHEDLFFGLMLQSLKQKAPIATPKKKRKEKAKNGRNKKG